MDAHCRTALLLAALSATGVLPGTAGLAAAFPLASYVPDRKRTVRLQMGLTYPFTAAVFAATCLGWRCAVVSWLA